MGDGSERRKYPRFGGKCIVDLLDEGEMPGQSPWEIRGPAEIENVSKGGFCIRSTSNLPLGSKITVVAYFLGMNSLCQCQIKWKTIEDESYSYGLEIMVRDSLDAHYQDQKILAPAA